jgi:hypothetical protein
MMAKVQIEKVQVGNLIQEGSVENRVKDLRVNDEGLVTLEYFSGETFTGAMGEKVIRTGHWPISNKEMKGMVEGAELVVKVEKTKVITRRVKTA